MSFSSSKSLLFHRAILVLYIFKNVRDLTRYV
nr:MAG TPA: hypothetical protein [Caudoviricetes sp.]